jgi:hypothetical protein
MVVLVIFESIRNTFDTDIKSGLAVQQSQIAILDALKIRI